MADSADDLLARARKCLSEQAVHGEMEPATAHDLAEIFGHIDVLLSSGGPLPTDWAAKPDETVRPVQDVPLPAGALPRRHAAEHHLRQALAGIAALREEIAGARMMLSGLSAENARLKAELDVHRDRIVLLCLDRNAEKAMSESRGERPGTILRTTDTGIEYELDGGLWTRRSSLGAGERTWAGGRGRWLGYSAGSRERRAPLPAR